MDTDMDTDTELIDPLPDPAAIDVAEVVKGANHSEVARHTGISLSHVNRILNRKRHPSAIKLAIIARELGVEMGALHTYLSRTGRGKKAA